MILRWEAEAEADHRDDRRDADHHANHGERRPQLSLAKIAPSKRHDVGEIHKAVCICDV